MMTDHNLDKLIKGSYANLASGYDHEAMWAAVEPHIDQRQRPIIFWWLLGFATLVGLAGAYMYMTHSSDHGSTAKVEARANSLEDIAAEQMINLPEALTAGDHDLMRVDQIHASDKHTAQNKAVKSRNGLDLKSNRISTSINKNRGASAEYFEDNAIQEIVSTMVQAGYTYLPEAADLLAQTGNESARDRILSQMLLHTIDPLSYDGGMSTIAPSLVPPPAAKTLPRSHSVELFAGYDMLDDQLRLTLPSGEEDLNNRSTQESALDRMTVGLQYIKPLHNRWEISLGAQYSQYTSKRAAMDRFTDIETRQVLVERIYREQGVEEVYGDQAVTTTTTRTSTTYLREREVSLVVGTRYHAIVKDRFSVFGEAYVLPRLNVGRSGSISHGSNLYDTSLDSDQIYLTSLAFDAQIGIGISYHLQDQLDVVTRFAASRRLTDMYSDNYGLQVRRNTIGLRMGLLRRF